MVVVVGLLAVVMVVSGVGSSGVVSGGVGNGGSGGVRCHYWVWWWCNVPLVAMVVVFVVISGYFGIRCHYWLWWWFKVP